MNQSAADDRDQTVPVRRHMRGLPGIDERTDEYLSVITNAAKAEGLDDKAACRIAFGFLKAYHPRDYSRLEKIGAIAHLT